MFFTSLDSNQQVLDPDVVVKASSNQAIIIDGVN